VGSLLASLASSADPLVAAVLLPLAIWILVNGFDDILIDIIGLRSAARRRATLDARTREAVANAPQKRIAIVVPCWQEHRVIGRMIQQNIEALSYSNYDFFVGVYPNDHATLAVVRELGARHSNVHAAVCPHDGPTSKADCLNWTWQAILRFEAAAGTRFEVIVTHDAEDVIHPRELHWINYCADSYGMIQVPVLPLVTPFTEWTHAVYCDEFTEYQSRDMPARDAMGAFIPSNGVGTGFRRDAVEALAKVKGHVFEPGCLTEDYENGYRLHRDGVRQIFLPLHNEGMATREFFPHRFRLAIRQRTRWVTGITLQTWERHGWSGNAITKYWLWRDRKGLLNNPVGIAANLICAYGSATWTASAAMGTQWPLAPIIAGHYALLASTTILLAHRVLYRMLCVAHIYGWRFACGVPVRMIYANVINSMAAANALRQFAMAKIRGRSLRWVKTSHEYPAQVIFMQDRRRIGDLLVARGRITADQLAHSLATKPDSRRLGEHLVLAGLVAEHDVYDALSAQHGLPWSRLQPSDVRRSIARALPAGIARECRVLPFRVEYASLCLAVPEVPTDQMRKQLRRYTMLDLRFHLVTPTDFNELVEALL
jgi:bacteriophage N4 adsorption protein B